MEKKNRIYQFIDEFQEEAIVKKNIYEHTWLSGSCTEVKPITIWANGIEIQWKSNRRIFDKFIKRIVERYSDLFEWGSFWKSDGSCPSHITFKFTDEFKAR